MMMKWLQVEHVSKTGLLLLLLAKNNGQSKIWSSSSNSEV